MRGILYGDTFRVPIGRIRIDWNHPLANGLILCLVRGEWVDIAGTSWVIGLTQQVASGLYGAGPEGMGYAGGPAAWTTALPASHSLEVTPISYYTRGWFTTQASGTGSLQGTSFQQPNVTPFVVTGIGLDGTGPPAKLQAKWNTAGVVQSLTSSGAAFSANSLCSAGASFPLPGGNTLVYQNGVQTGSLSFGGNPANFTATSNYTNGDANFVRYVQYVWSRVLTAAEFLWLHNSPYELLIPVDSEMSELGSPIPPLPTMPVPELSIPVRDRVKMIGY